ncbi:MAG TPA: nuclear transport factor 2 family protein [Falsiroseomonas sp.]|jgi:ketosteroid isomerase-like protein|nr:nuclear transport factor 2 family protein [Falsiroseomonas sp.]
MPSSIETARAFFEACDTGKGWEACRPYCTPDATFDAQSDVLAEISTLQAYAEWMRNLLTVLTDGRYELKCFAEDATRGSVCAFGTFIGTHLAGGPRPPTGRTTHTDYVYVMTLRDGKVAHVTKVWNSGYALKELGWA